MAVNSVANILVTGAKLWYAPVGEALPDETSVDYDGAWGGNWAQLGFTLSPLQISYTQTFFGVDVQQRAGRVKNFPLDNTVVANTTLAEVDGPILAVLMNGGNTATAAGASQKGFDSMVFGGKRTITHYAVGFEGVREDEGSTPANQPIRLFFFKATISASGAIPFDKASPTGIPITVEAMVDPTLTEGEGIGTWHIVTAPATA